MTRSQSRRVDPDFAERRGARSASTFECFDDDHAAATAWAWTREDARLGLIAVIGALVLFAWDRRGEQLTRVGDVVGADAACEQSVMADAVKTCWQDMDEEAADELVGREPHDLLPRVAIDAVILVLERDAGAVAGKQAAVGDGDAVGVAREIAQHVLGPPKGRLL